MCLGFKVVDWVLSPTIVWGGRYPVSHHRKNKQGGHFNLLLPEPQASYGHGVGYI